MTEQQPIAYEGTATGENSSTDVPAGQGKARSSRNVYLAIIGVGALIIATIIFFALQGRGQTLTVNFGLIDFDGSSSCAGGTGGYSDVGPGMDVVVRDNDGQVIATGALAAGGEDLDGSGCVWTAVLDDVPGGQHTVRADRPA